MPAEAIDAEIERMRRAWPASRPSSGPPATATSSVIDYTGSIDGEPFEGGAATDFLLELGSETLIEGFNEQLTGSSAGDARTVEVTFPDEYHAEHLSGKEASFEVAVKEVREKRLPELDDDFAADNSDFDTLAELRGDIESRLLHQAEHRVEHQFNDAAIDAAVANADDRYPRRDHHEPRDRDLGAGRALAPAAGDGPERLSADPGQGPRRGDRRCPR